MANKTCKNCGAPVHVVNYALGSELEHYDPNASFPTRRKGTAWLYCRLKRAEIE